MKALEMFGIVLDNYENLEKEIREQVYKSIGINSENEKLNEFIKECIEHFDLNLVERNFLSQLQNTINEELSKIRQQKSEKNMVDYDSISNSLTERLRKNEPKSISLDDDFMNLATQISSKFQTGITREQFYQHLMSKKENIINMILSYNKNIVDSLVKLTPQLMEEMQQLQKNQNVKEDQQNQESKKNTSINPNQAINTLIATSKKQYNELQRRLSYLNSGSYNVSSSRILFEKEELKKAILQLGEFIEKLSAGKYTQDLISKFSDTQELNVICNNVIHQEIPSLMSVSNLTNEVEKQYGHQAQVNYSNYSMPSINIEELHKKIISSSNLKDLMQGKASIEQVLGTYDYDTNKNLEVEYSILIDKIITLSMSNTKNKNSNPNPTPNNETAIGNSNDDVMSLIDSNQYFGVLQAIPKLQTDKYREFINYGLNEIMNKWNQKATLAKSYDERLISYQEFKTLFDNFKDYIPIEVADMLRTNLKDMESFIQQHRPKNAELDSIRYNGEISQEQKTSMKM